MRMRARPGEGITKRLQARETRLRAAFTRIEAQRKVARDKVTGKSRAQIAVKTWLNKLNTEELRHEAEIRGFVWKQFESIDQAIDTVHVAIFSGVVVCGGSGSAQPVTPEPHTGQLAFQFPAGRDLGTEEETMALLWREGNTRSSLNTD